MIRIETKQLDLLSSKLKKMSGTVSKSGSSIFRNFANNIYKDIKYRSPVDQGTYEESWVFVETNINEYTIRNGLPYSEIMETGSTAGQPPWPNVGPRTIKVGGEIWSNQHPGPVAGKAVETADWDGLKEDILNSLEDI